jgi:MFS family permease
MTVMAGAIIAPALPDIERVFAGQPRVELLVRLVLTLPALFTAMVAPLAGWTIDRFGRRRLLLGGMMLYLIAGTSGLYATSLYELLIGRAFLGIAVAFILTASVTLIADLFSDHDREHFLGLQSGFMGLTAMLFLTFGGFLAEQHWRAPFGIYLVGIFVALFAARHVRETRPATHQMPHETAPTTTSPTTPGAAVAVPTSSFRIAVIYACGFLGMLLFYLIPVQLPFYLQDITEGAASRAGLAIGCLTVVGAMTSLQYRRLRRLLGFRSIFSMMFVIVGVSFLLLSQVTSYATTIAALAFGGIGFGLLVPNSNVWLASLAPKKIRGRLIGGLTTCFFVGQFLSPIAAQPTLNRYGLGGLQGVYGMAGFFSLSVGVAFFIAGPLWKRLHR